MSLLKLNSNNGAKQTNNVSRETDSYVVESNILGREEDKKGDYKLVEEITWKPKCLHGCYCWYGWFGKDGSCSIGIQR